MNIWKSVKGYVRIRVSGLNQERVLNRAASEGIALTDVQRCVGGALTADVAVRDLKRLRIAVRGCGCSVHILQKHGAPMIAFAIRRNRLLAAGAAIAFILLVLASTRVWHIDIDGVGIDREAVMQILSDEGIGVGTARRSIHPTHVGKLISGGDIGVVHADVELNGVVLDIHATAADDFSVTEGDDRPASIYADKDCVITSISVTRGRAAVKVGDVVLAGQLLISGDLSEQKEGFAVHAEGEIKGRVLYNATASAAQGTTRLQRSGNSERLTVIQIFGHEFIPELPYEYYDLEYVSRRIIDGCGIPIAAYTMVCYELTEQPFTETAVETETRALIAAQEELKRMLSKSASIISVTHNCLWSADGVKVYLTVETIETIGSKRYL